MLHQLTFYSEKMFNRYLFSKSEGQTNPSRLFYAFGNVHYVNVKPSIFDAIGGLKTDAAIFNAHLSRVCKRGKLSGSCISTLNGFGSTQLPIFLCHIGVPTFSSQNN